MSATKFLRDQHKIIKGLFRQIETVDLRAPEMKQGVVRQLRAEFEIHSALEEEIFYPALRDALGASEQAMVDEALAAHRDAAGMLDRFEEFKDSFATHLDDEEGRMFERAEVLLKDTDLETRLKARDMELRTSEKYRDAQPAITQNPHGGEQVRTKDKVA